MTTEILKRDHRGREQFQTIIPELSNSQTKKTGFCKCGKEIEIITIAGFDLPPICGECSAKFEKAQAIEEEKNRMKKINKSLVDFSGYFKRHLRQTFDNYICDYDDQLLTKNICKAFIGIKNKWLLLIGKPGTGKDHLASAIGREFYKTGSVWAGNESDLIMKYNSIMFESSEEQAINFFGELGLLIIRDLGVKDLTDNARTTLTNILDRRYNCERSVVITTNASPAMLNELLDVRTLDRLREMAIYNGSNPFLLCTWKSYRGKFNKSTQEMN